MGLDVILKKGRKDLGWSDAVMKSFLFEKKIEKFPVYEGSEGYEEYVGERDHEYIGEVCGMGCVGTVSFRGRHLDSIVRNLAGSHWSLYQDLSSSDVSHLATFLKEHLGEVPADEQEDIKNLATLFEWMSANGLSTRASY